LLTGTIDYIGLALDDGSSVELSASGIFAVDNWGGDIWWA
jgi:hypothetical protein